MDTFSEVDRTSFTYDTHGPLLKNRFANAEDVSRNYSQALQDLFVLSILNGKKNGTYVEIGAGHPTNINNSYLLESVFGWRGVSYEIQEDLANYFNETRTNKCICADATTTDYTRSFESNNLPARIDYLQVDIDPSEQSLESLKRLDLNEYRFSVITFEHDAYQGKQHVVDESRKILRSYGYQCVASNVKNQGHPFEDWYVDPSIVSSDVWSKFVCDSVSSSEVLFMPSIT